MPPHSWLNSPLLRRPSHSHRGGGPLSYPGHGGESPHNKAAAPPLFRPTAYSASKVEWSGKFSGTVKVQSRTVPSTFPHASIRFHRRDRAMSRSEADRGWGKSGSVRYGP